MIMCTEALVEFNNNNTELRTIDPKGISRSFHHNFKVTRKAAVTISPRFSHYKKIFSSYDVHIFETQCHNKHYLVFKKDWQLVTVAVVVCGIHGEKKFEKNILTQNAYIKLKDRANSTFSTLQLQFLSNLTKARLG
ncbi:hypothetical protein CUMW_216070 [Citrus unshiu]|uniref:Uncharacterized protein n=1 Tax=Citrus unshiu TaxID=55188 RepID=A0A2H5QCB5_CITUN|nr:hypothetical protein CUMW_216070 [Citrus unshiu]